MIAPVHSLGPGERVCLWTQGCNRSCPGCISPELQPFTGSNADEQMLGEILLRTAEINACSGLTLSGGDPFAQPEALLRLLEHVRAGFADILVYTGFTLEEIRNGNCGKAGIECLGLIDVLIDGPYIDEQNTHGCVLRGSENQTIRYLNPKLAEDYETYLQKGRILETFSHNGSVVITGIQDRRELH